MSYDYDRTVEAGELVRVWVVRDPGPNTLFEEMVFEWPVSRLYDLMVGTGRKWLQERTKLYTDEASAKRDAEKRWRAVRS